MTIISVIAVIIGLALTVVMIMAALAQIKTYNLLKDIVDFGGIPSLAGYTLKKQAQEIIYMGYTNDKKKANTISTSLRNMKDAKAHELADKLDEILKT